MRSEGDRSGLEAGRFSSQAVYHKVRLQHLQNEEVTILTRSLKIIVIYYFLNLFILLVLLMHAASVYNQTLSQGNVQQKQ